MTILFIFLAVFDLYWQSYFRGLGKGMDNWGVSFGSWQGWGMRVSLVVFTLLIFWGISLRFRKKRVGNWFVMLVLGGGVNLASRLIWGSVWDYLCFPHLPFCFNVSDLLISLGVLSYILRINGNRSSV